MNDKTAREVRALAGPHGVKIVYEMTEENQEALAVKLAKIMGLLTANKPMTADQVGKLLGVSGESIRLGVQAGKIPKLPGFGKRVLIARETDRLQRGEPVTGRRD